MSTKLYFCSIDEELFDEDTPVVSLTDGKTWDENKCCSDELPE